jgi:hypothetical protein
MNGLSLVTKGFITPVKPIEANPVLNVGGGSPPVFRDENLPKPLIKVQGIKIDKGKKEPFTEDTIRVKTVKIIVDEKD